jgi:glycosyltransferase involved in cell wall biosynthesis
MLLPKEMQRASNAFASRRPSNGLTPLYDLVFVLNINSKGWILEKICTVIAQQLGLRTKIVFTERNNTVTGWLPASRSYFFSHYKIYMGALNSGILPADCKTYVWFTHPSFSGGNTVEAFVSALNECTTTFTANSFHASALAFLGVEPEKLKTILGGADPDHFRPTPRKGQTVGIVGAYYERKNPDLLLDVVRAMPDVSFILIAPHPSEVENKSLLWENWKRFPELRDLPNLRYISARFEEFGGHYDDMDVYLSLSKLEGGPIPLIEAMFANCYPVVTRTGFAEDIVTHGENGLLLPTSASLKQVERELRTALSNLTTDVAATVADYSWEAFGLNFRDAIDPSAPVGRDVSFALTESRLDYLRDGWGEQDPSGVWLAMKSGTVRMRVASDSRAVAVSFLAQPAVGLEGVPLKIRVNGRTVEDAVFEGGPHSRELPLTSEDVDGAMTIVLELSAARVEDLGTICLESIAPIARDAVVDAPDSAGLIASRWDIEGTFEATPVFEVPVVMLGAPDRPQSRQIRRALHSSFGIPTLPNNGRFEPGWDGIAIAEGFSGDRVTQLGRVDGLIAAAAERMYALRKDAPDVPAIVIPDIVGAPLTGHPSTPAVSMSSAVVFTTAAQTESSLDWISAVLTSKGIKTTVSKAAALTASGNISDLRAAVAAVAQDADLCLFSGSEEELPFIATCLGMGIPVLLYGPSELYPDLVAHGVRHAFIQNASRLAKTLSMLAEARARRGIVEQFQRMLRSARGLQAATDRYARFARGLIDKRKIARLRPNIAVFCAGSSNGEDVSQIRVFVSMLLDLECRVSVLCASQDIEVSIAHPDLQVAYMGQDAGAKSPLASPAANQRFSSFVKERRPDLVLCFSESSLAFVETVEEVGVRAVYVAGSGGASDEPARYNSGPTSGTIRVPRLLPPKISATFVSAMMKDKATARKQLGFRADEVVVFCAPHGRGSPHKEPYIVRALELARETGNRIRLVFENDEDEFGGGYIEKLRRKATSRQTVEVSNVSAERIDLAVRAADLALITAQPNDATLFLRALAFGIPIIAQNDVVGSDLLGPRASGWVYDSHDRDDFESNFKALLANAPLRQKLSAQAQATASGMPGSDETILGIASGIINALEA